MSYKGADRQPPARSIMPKIVSANRLADGVVVYLGRDAQWVESLNHARAFDDEGSARAGLTKAHEDSIRNLVVEPFLVEVELDARGLRPVTLRNAIRAGGPTIDYAPRASAPAAPIDRSRDVSL
jgi:hypothetical protein